MFYLLIYFKTTLTQLNTVHHIFANDVILPSWPWSYGSWIYNYLCNQCLSPPMLWVQISIRARCGTLCDKVCQWLATGLRVLRFPPPIKLTAMI